MLDFLNSKRDAEFGSGKNTLMFLGPPDFSGKFPYELVISVTFFDAFTLLFLLIFVNSTRSFSDGIFTLPFPSLSET